MNRVDPEVHCPQVAEASSCRRSVTAAVSPHVGRSVVVYEGESYVHGITSWGF
jgi:hypothetical protein